MRYSLLTNKKAQQVNQEGRLIIAIVLIVLFAIGAMIIIARSLFPYFVILSGIAFIFTVIAGIRDIFFREEYEDIWFIFPLVALGVLLLISAILLGVGYGLSETGIGQAGLTVYGVFGIVNEVQQNVTTTLYNDIPKQVLNETCKTLNNSIGCDIADKGIDTANAMMGIADNLQTVKDVANIAKKV